MTAIWKFKLGFDRRQAIEMPAGSKVLTAQMQEGELFIWAVVQIEAPRELKNFRVVGTGHIAELDGPKYVNTVQDGQLVWHVFEILP